GHHHDRPHGEEQAEIAGTPVVPAHGHVHGHVHVHFHGAVPHARHGPVVPGKPEPGDNGDQRQCTSGQQAFAPQPTGGRASSRTASRSTSRNGRGSSWSGHTRGPAALPWP